MATHTKVIVSVSVSPLHDYEGDPVLPLVDSSSGFNKSPSVPLNKSLTLYPELPERHQPIVVGGP